MNIRLEDKKTRIYEDFCLTQFSVRFIIQTDVIIEWVFRNRAPRN